MPCVFRSKIHRYSPGESAKANDKQVVRKRPDLVFDPTNISDYLTRKRDGSLARHPANDRDYKTMVVRQYFEVRDSGGLVVVLGRKFCDDLRIVWGYQFETWSVTKDFVLFLCTRVDFACSQYYDYDFR